jgi:hypothetical protein
MVIDREVENTLQLLPNLVFMRDDDELAGHPSRLV